MIKTREQELVDIMFQIVIVAADKMHKKKPEEIAAWVSDQLQQCGFPTTPCGASWGVLDSKEEK